MGLLHRITKANFYHFGKEHATCRGILKLGTERDAGTANASMGRGGKAVFLRNEQAEKEGSPQ